MGDTGIIEISGEVDIATVSLLAKALADAVRLSKGHLILDAQGLTYIDSAGIQTLVSTQRKLNASGRCLAVVGCHGIFHKLMKITHFDTRFPIYSSVDEALAKLGDWIAPSA